MKDAANNKKNCSVSEAEICLEKKSDQSIEKDVRKQLLEPSLNDPEGSSNNSKQDNMLKIYTKQPMKEDFLKPLLKRSLHDSNGPLTKKRNKTEKKPSNELRFDKIEHFPEMENCTPVRCKNDDCHFKSRVFCIKCKVHLCLIQGRNCFKDFHYIGKENTLSAHH